MKSKLMDAFLVAVIAWSRPPRKTCACDSLAAHRECQAAPPNYRRPGLRRRGQTMTTNFREFAACMLLLFAAPLAASPISDPAGDFLATYVGPLNSDLDLLLVSAIRSSTGVQLNARVGGAIGATASGSVIFGVDRGAGFPGLIASGPPSLGTPAMLFDAVVVMGFDGAGRIRTFGGGGFVDTVLDLGTVVISGDAIEAFIPFSLLSTTGFAQADYRYTTWTRSQLGTQAYIADLAPDDRSFRAVPEPATWAMLIVGFGLIGGLTRRERVGRARA